MKNPYEGAEDQAFKDAGQALEELICRTAEECTSHPKCRMYRCHTNFILPENNGALIVVRFAGPGSLEQAERLRKLIDAWS